MSNPYSMEPSEYYTRNAAQHDQETQEDNLPEAFFQLRDRFEELLPGKKVLDLGCGTGRDTEHFTQEGLDATGIDIARGAIKYAREHRNGSFQQGDMRNIPFNDQRFHGVWCAASIFFLPPDTMPQATDEIYRVLQPGGVAYIGFKLGDSPFQKQEWEGEVTQYRVPASTARDIVTGAGLDLIDWTENQSKDGRTFGNAFCRRPSQ